MKNIKLFDKRIIDYKVQTKKLGEVAYVNLDNAATTVPMKCVEEGVKKYLAGYGSVHRGAGEKSKISTDVYEESREIIKKFVDAESDSYVIYTGNTTGAINTLAYFFSFLKGKIAVSTIEHSSSWLPWIKEEGVKKIGAKRFGLNKLDKLNERIQKLGSKEVVFYDINDNFEFDLGSIESILSKNKIKAFVLTGASNVTGYCPDIKKISELGIF